MRKILFILSYTFYIFFVLGLFLHTSAHPQVFGKYTIKYSLLLIFLIIFFPLFLWLINFAGKRSTIKIKRGKFTIIPINKVLIFLISIVLFVVAPTEIYLRYKFRRYESNTYRYTIENFDPFLQSKIAKHEGLTVNNLGFRGEEIAIRKQNGTYRIFVLGGSTVLNREVLFEKNAVRLLEKKLRLRFPGRKIEVINAGKDYYTSEHSLIQYMFKIADLNPDLIIMWHGANDIMASCALEGVISHGEYNSDYSHLFGAVSNIVFNYFRPQTIVQIKLVTFDFLVKSFQDNLYSDMIKNLINKNREKATLDFAQGKNTITVHDFPSIVAYSRNLSYFINFAKNRGTPLILGNQPTLIKENNSLEELKVIIFPRLTCTQNGKYYNLESLSYSLNLFNKETEKVAKDNNIMFVDLNKNVPKNLKYFFDGFHYTEKGNEHVANILYDFIISKGLIVD